jgi:hypothetical protein
MMRCVAPSWAGRFKTVGEMARGQKLEPLESERRPQTVAADARQSAAIAGRDVDIRVKGEALEVRAAGAMSCRMQAGAGRLDSSRVGVREVVDVDSDLGWIETPEEEQYLASDRAVDVLHILIGGRRQDEEGRLCTGVRLASEQAIGHEAVEVDVEAKGAREALHEGDGTRATVTPAETARLAALHAKMARRVMARTRAVNLASKARASRNRRGKLITHWRYGISGRTRSTRKAAPSSMRRVAQEGQAARDLHEKATRRSSPQASQWTRRNPRARTPQSSDARISRSTNRGSATPCARCRDRKARSDRE